MIRKMLLSSLLYSLPLLSSLQEVEDRSGLHIETPSLKNRKEKRLRLDNGLEILLISDPNTSTSGAALAVEVGSWNDPESRPGMAHFVEHLLFLGTTKYPDESEYTRYLDEYNGKRNAYTAADKTVYMFDTTNEGFLGALDRFGQFFISPLFNPSGVGREMQAIEQEYCKNIPIDGWRSHYVNKTQINPKHPQHRFCIGNLETLKKISQIELKEWYHAHYSADIMHLAIYSALSLEELENVVIPLFSQVKRGSFKPQTPSESLFTAETTKNLVWIKPQQKIQSLDIFWEIPTQLSKNQEVQAHRIISQIIGHEGEHSLASLLKRKGFIDALDCGSMREGYDQRVFILSLSLTNKGLKEYETVIDLCYESLAMLRANPLPEYLFNECVKLEEISYTFQSKKEVFNYLMDLAASMCEEPLETFPLYTTRPTKYAPDEYSKLLACLTPEKGLHTLTCEHPPTSDIQIQEEKWLGAQYAKIPLSNHLRKKWAKTTFTKELALPKPNPYIPEDLKVAEAKEDKSFPKPELIAHSEKLSLYYCTDLRFGVPKVAWNFQIRTPRLDPGHPKDQVAIDFFCHCLEEKLKEITYPASIAHLQFSLASSQKGITLEVNGFADKAHVLLETVVSHFHNFSMTKEEFERYKALAKRAYHNQSNKSSLAQAALHLNEILYSPYCSVTDKERVVENFTYQEVITFAHDLWEQVYIEGVLFGKTSRAEAEQVASLLEKAFASSRPFLKRDHPDIKVATFPHTRNPLFVELKSELPSNAVIMVTECGEFSFKKRAAQMILTKGLKDPFFTELRTKQQTAYILSNWDKEIEKQLYCFFAIQSSSHETRDLLSRFELFLESSLQELKEEVITEERFMTIKNSLLKRLEDPAENVVKMGSLLATIAFEHDADFDRRDKLMEGFRELSYLEFLDYAQEYLGKENHKRFAVCVTGTISPETRFEYLSIPSVKELKEMVVYKSKEAK